MPPAPPHRALGLLGALWGVGGLAWILLSAILRLIGHVQDAFIAGIERQHFIFGVVWVLAMALGEGVKGFHQAFSPRAVVRARCLAQQPRPLWILLAPLFCAGMVHATRRRLAVSWGITAMVVALVLVIRLVPQPWRGLVDAGVVAGLSVGLLSLLGWSLVALRGGRLPVPPDLPDQA